MVDEGIAAKIVIFWEPKEADPSLGLIMKETMFDWFRSYI